MPMSVVERYQSGTKKVLSLSELAGTVLGVGTTLGGVHVLCDMSRCGRRLPCACMFFACMLGGCCARARMLCVLFSFCCVLFGRSGVLFPSSLSLCLLFLFFFLLLFFCLCLFFLPQLLALKEESNSPEYAWVSRGSVIWYLNPVIIFLHNPLW